MEPTAETTGAARHALVLRHHEEDDAGLIGAALRARGYEVTTILIDETHPAPTSVPRDCAIVVVLGANSSVYDPRVQRDWLGAEMSLLEAVDRAGVAILGICFGAQVLCHLFGGEVRRAERGEIGWTTVDVVAGAALSAGPWFEYHGDRCELPAGATVWATTARAVQAFWLGRHFGVQFHPEIDDVQLARWFASDGDGERPHAGREAALLAETRRETPAATVRAQELVDLFLAHAGAGGPGGAVRPGS